MNRTPRTETWDEQLLVHQEPQHGLAELALRLCRTALDERLQARIEQAFAG
jgi:hypothetical protein